MAHEGIESVVRFCGKCDCGCPELFLDHRAPDDKRIIITDDFGQRIQMSMAQLSDLVADVKAGTLDQLVS